MMSSSSTTLYKSAILQDDDSQKRLPPMSASAPTTTTVSKKGPRLQRSCSCIYITLPVFGRFAARHCPRRKYDRASVHARDDVPSYRGRAPARRARLGTRVLRALAVRQYWYKFWYSHSRTCAARGRPRRTGDGCGDGGRALDLDGRRGRRGRERDGDGA